MSELKILFDNDYPKLHGQKQAKLLMSIGDVSEALLRTKFADLLDYDTQRSDGKFYRSWQVGEKFLLLLFLGDKGILFTSLRKNNEENRNIYNNSVGDIFEIIIKEA